MGEKATLRRGFLRWARILFAIAIVGIMTTVVISGASDITWAEGLWARLIVASLLGLAGLLAAAMSWAAVIGAPPGLAIATMGTTMPLRHLPLGGFGQMMGMSALAQAAKAGRASISYSTPLFLAATGGAASLVAMPVAWANGTPTWLRMVVGAAVAGTALMMWQGDRLLRILLTRFNRKLPSGATSMVKPVAWSVVAVLATSAAFVILFPASESLVDGISRFAASWLCGFLFVIAPAGLGVREGALVALWPGVEPATVVAAAVVHRLSTLIAEAVLFVVAWRLSRQLTARDLEKGTGPIPGQEPGGADI